MEKINTNYIIETLNCLIRCMALCKRVNLCDDVSQLSSQVVVVQL